MFFIVDTGDEFTKVNSEPIDRDKRAELYTDNFIEQFTSHVASIVLRGDYNIYDLSILHTTR